MAQEADEGPKEPTNRSTSANEAVKIALSQLKPASGVSQAERVLNVIKTKSEIEKLGAEKNKADQDAKKAEVDAHLAARQLRYALISSVVAPLVPLASLFTVAVTLYVSSEQMRITRDQGAQKLAEDRAIREEENWKAFEDALDKSSPDALYATGTFISRLRTFAEAGKYKSQLLDISKQLMSGLTSATAFQDVWRVAFQKTDDANFAQVVELARAKKVQFDRMASDCKSYKIPSGLPDDITWTYIGLCSPKYSTEDLSKSVSDPAVLKAVLASKDALTNTSTIQYFLSNEISGYIRAVSTKQKGAKAFDLSNIVLSFSNLDDVDFSQMNLTQATIASSTVRGAILTPIASTYDLRATPWWDAEAIDQKILQYELLNQYPARAGVLYPTGYTITRDDFRKKIEKLCTSKIAACSDECLRFGPSVQADLPAACTANQ